jgi:RNA polymerase sigma-70 factor (ECF subfamily)
MTDRQLIRLMQEDPEKGLRQVMQLYGGAIYTICVHILDGASREDVEEAVSDSLLAIWKSREHFNESYGTSFKSYCYGIVRKTALTKRKILVGDQELIPLEEDMLPAQKNVIDELEKKEDERILHEVIDTLEEPERSVFILRYFYFFRVKEIAARLHISDKKVENCLYRGKQRLKTALLKRGLER